MNKDLDNGLAKICFGIWFSITTVIIIIVEAIDKFTNPATVNEWNINLVVVIGVIFVGICAMIITSGINSLVKYIKKS